MKTFLWAAILLFSAPAWAQTSTFTYQGKLEESSGPATGQYDFEFALYDDPSAGTQVAGPDVVEDVAVEDGLFQASIDFGAGAFSGGDRWLEIRVRPGSSTDPFTVMASRQAVAPSPLALHSRSVAEGAVGTSQIAAGAVTADEVDDSQVQLRVGAGCTTGSSIRQINADGTVLCEPDDDSGGDISGVDAGSGLEGGGASGSVSLAIADDGVTDAMLSPGAVTLPAVGTRPSTGVRLTGESLSSGVLNILNWDSEDWDTGGLHGTGTLDPYIFPDQPGLYLVTANLVYESGIDARREARMTYLNADQSSSEIIATHHGSERAMTLTSVYPFQGDGDRVYITVSVQTNSSMNASIPSRFTATWIGPLP
jgi:hypothetical protein